MKIAYFDCISGISGDMTLGALIDAGVPLELIDRAIQSLGVPGLHLEVENVKRHTMRALQVHVRCPHEHVHRHLSDIVRMIEQGVAASSITRSAGDLAIAIFNKLAEAEAKVHGESIEKVHFHEVGAADSIADIVGAAVGIDYLQLEAICASPVPTGTGTIKIAHGTCSIPAPATAELLKGVPLLTSQVPFELTTPTGAAILKTVVQAFTPVPSMTILSTGCGAGGRDLPEQANILRLIIGETLDREAWEKALPSAAFVLQPLQSPLIESEPTTHHSKHGSKPKKHGQRDDHHHDHDHAQRHAHDHEHSHDHDHTDDHHHSHPHTHDDTDVWVLETNLDDMTGEMIGYCISRLWDINPLDVFTTPIQMKKNRPGVKLTIICHEHNIDDIETVLFQHTSTLGIRRWPVERTVLQREQLAVETTWGTIEGKTALLNDGTVRFTPEFDSAKKLAGKYNVPLADIYYAAQQAFHKAKPLE